MAAQHVPHVRGDVLLVVWGGVALGEPGDVESVVRVRTVGERVRRKADARREARARGTTRAGDRADTRGAHGRGWRALDVTEEVGDGESGCGGACNTTSTHRRHRQPLHSVA